MTICGSAAPVSTSFPRRSPQYSNCNADSHGVFAEAFIYHCHDTVVVESLVLLGVKGGREGKSVLRYFLLKALHFARREYDVRTSDVLASRRCV